MTCKCEMFLAEKGCGIETLRDTPSIPVPKGALRPIRTASVGAFMTCTTTPTHLPTACNVYMNVYDGMTRQRNVIFPHGFPSLSLALEKFLAGLTKPFRFGSGWGRKEVPESHTVRVCEDTSSSSRNHCCRAVHVDPEIK